MALALAEARAAARDGEVPVGAVTIMDGKVVASRHNERERTADPTAHAEMLAMRDTAASVGNWRLSDVTVVVTLEPCLMCAGALISRKGRPTRLRRRRPPRRSLRNPLQRLCRPPAEPRARGHARREGGRVQRAPDVVLRSQARRRGDNPRGPWIDTET